MARSIIVAACALALVGCGDWDWDVPNFSAGGKPDGDVESGIPEGGDPCDRAMATIQDNADDGTVAGVPGSPEFYRDGEPGDGTSGIHMGVWTNGRTYAYLRFALPRVLRDATTVSRAYLEFFARGTAGGDFGAPGGTTLRISLEDSADPAQVDPADTDEAIRAETPEGSRTVLPEHVAWDVAAGSGWAPLDYQRSADVAPLLAKLIENHGTRNAGSHVQFWIANFSAADGTQAEYVADDFANDGTNTARLVIERDNCAD